MSSKGNRPIAGERRASENESSHDARGEEPNQIAARVAQELRDSGVPCETVIPVPTEAAALRRDRIVINLTLIVLTALAWSYLLWLSADMAMDGMDLSDSRMIPSGMGLMMPAHTPWRAMEFAFVFAMWTRDDGWHDDALGSADDSHVRPCRPTNSSARHAPRCDRLVRDRLFPCLGRFLATRHPAAVGT